jgi:hypothetical protein
VPVPFIDGPSGWNVRKRGQSVISQAAPWIMGMGIMKMGPAKMGQAPIFVIGASPIFGTGTDRLALVQIVRRT